MRVDLDIPAGGSYTAPEDGIYVLVVKSKSTLNAWWLLNGDIRLFGGYGGTDSEISAPVPLAKGSVLTTRKGNGLNYYVMHYFALK